MTGEVTLPKWFDLPASGQTWEYGAGNVASPHRSHLPMFLPPPAVDMDTDEDEDRDFDCE